MIQALLNWQIDKAERQLGVPLDEARYVAGVSWSATWRLARFTKLLHASQGSDHARHIASLVGSMADDCGSCVQIGVNISRQVGVPREQLSAVIERRPEDLPEELAAVYRFAEAVTLNSDDQDELREVVRKLYGDRGLVEICIAVAMHRVFPTLKRGLGFAKSCSRVVVEV
jgi:alkylhydroperoxidase family enzyme